MAPMRNPFNERAGEALGFATPEFRRAHQGSRCEACGRVYWKHPMDYVNLDFQRDPYLHILCDGSLVKL